MGRGGKVSFVSPTVFIVATWTAAICGGVGIGAAFISAIVGYQLTEKSLKDSDVKIAEANARAKEAELKLEEFRKARAEMLVSAEVRAAITAKLKPFAGTRFDIGYTREDREQSDFLWVLLPLINAAGWVHIDWAGGEMFKLANWPGDHWMGAMAVSNVSIELHPASREKLEPAAEALADALKSAGIHAGVEYFNNSSTNIDAVHLLVGPKR
jgi:hypothetical protein